MTRTIVESKSKTAIIGFDQPFCVIGERINPTGRKKLARELEAGDFSTIESDALAQVAAGATMLDINAGVVYNSNPNPNETEPPLMQEVIRRVQALVARVELHMHDVPAFELQVTDLPLFSLAIAGKDKATLTRADEHFHLWVI